MMRVENSAGKSTSGIDNFGSVIDIMNMKLGSKLLRGYKEASLLFEHQDLAP